jgi:hypothetical protein
MYLRMKKQYQLGVVIKLLGTQPQSRKSNRMCQYERIEPIFFQFLSAQISPSFSNSSPIFFQLLSAQIATNYIQDSPIYFEDNWIMNLFMLFVLSYKSVRSVAFAVGNAITQMRIMLAGQISGYKRTKLCRCCWLPELAF